MKSVLTPLQLKGFLGAERKVQMNIMKHKNHRKEKMGAPKKFDGPRPNLMHKEGCGNGPAPRPMKKDFGKPRQEPKAETK